MLISRHMIIQSQARFLDRYITHLTEAHLLQSAADGHRRMRDARCSPIAMQTSCEPSLSDTRGSHTKTR